MNNEHPEQQALSDYAAGKLDEQRAALVESHVADCPECDVTLQRIEGQSDTLVAGLREPERSPTENYAREEAYQRAIEQAANLPEVTALHGQPTTISPASSNAADENLSKKLGPYELLAKLGEGGMGAVYRAQHEHLGKTVAIKILPAVAMRDPALVGRFRREMKAVGALHHPNIVGAHDAGEAGGVHFLVMEYVAGKDLSTILKEQGPLPVEQAISCTLQAARGLEFAHRKGIVHRDIKPANLLLDEEGTLKILDMGLARLDDNAHNIAAQEGLTQSGQVMGTVDYMAPEQAFDTHRADARADVYSLGCTLYRLLTGQNAYAGETIVQKILAHREKPIPSLRAARPQVPAALDALFKRMLAKNAQERISMGDVVKELAAIQTALAPATESFNLKQAPAAIAPTPAVHGGGGKKKIPSSWLAAGLGGAAALILLTIVFIIRDKDGKEIARVNGPDGSSVTVQGTEPPKNAKPPAGSPSKTATEPNTTSSSVPGDLADWEKQTAALPPQQQLEAFRKKMIELNPGFDGKLTGGYKDDAPQFKDNAVVSLGFNTEFVSDLRPIKVFTKLTKLQLLGVKDNHKSLLRDLRPLAGLKLVSFSCMFNSIEDLSPLRGMPLEGLLLTDNPISDLTPLQGMPLVTLAMNSCYQVQDITALRGMPLINLTMHGIAATDFSPLAGLPLRSLNLHGTKFRDVKLLVGMPLEWADLGQTQIADIKALGEFTTIHTLGLSQMQLNPADIAALQAKLPNCKIEWDAPAAEPPAVASQKFAFEQPDFAAWAAEVGRRNPETQLAMVIQKLQELNPKYDGKETHRIQNNDVQELVLPTTQVTDLSPVRALTELKVFKCGGTEGYKGLLASLAPLQGMKLTRLEFYYTNVADLTPLRGMPLEALICFGTNIDNLGPLEGMPLKELWCFECKGITDLSPLRKAPLKVLQCYATGIRDLAPLADCPLVTLLCNNTQVSDLTPLRGKELIHLNIGRTKVKDLTPLETCLKLKTLDMLWNKYSSAEIEKLQRTLPNCKIALSPEASSPSVEPLPTSDETDAEWEARVALLPNAKQSAEVRKRLIDRNPGLLDTHIATKQEHNQIVYLKIFPSKLMDLSPVRGFPKLKELVCADNKQTSNFTDLKPLQGMAIQRLVISYSQVSDLSPIAKLPLTDLVITGTQVSDLKPLAEMKLAVLHAEETPIASLEPLRGMPLKHLWVIQTRVTDLTPIAECPLDSLYVDFCKISDLNNLKKMPLTHLSVAYTPVANLSPLVDLKLVFLNCENAKVSDLSPLRGMPLRALWCNGSNPCTDYSPLQELPLESLRLNYKPERDKALLEAIPTLKSINLKPAKEFLAQGEGMTK